MDYLQTVVCTLMRDHFEDENVASNIASFVSLLGEKSLALVKKYRLFARAHESTSRKRAMPTSNVYLFQKLYMSTFSTFRMDEIPRCIRNQGAHAVGDFVNEKQKQACVTYKVIIEK